MIQALGLSVSFRFFVFQCPLRCSSFPYLISRFAVSINVENFAIGAIFGLRNG